MNNDPLTGAMADLMGQQNKLLVPVRVEFNRNSLRMESWLEARTLSDGSTELIGMGRRIEIDADTGAVVSDVTEPTGIRAWMPVEAAQFVGMRRPDARLPWWRRLINGIVHA